MPPPLGQNMCQIDEKLKVVEQPVVFVLEYGGCRDNLERKLVTYGIFY